MALHTSRSPARLDLAVAVPSGPGLRALRALAMALALSWKESESSTVLLALARLGDGKQVTEGAAAGDVKSVGTGNTTDAIGLCTSDGVMPSGVLSDEREARLHLPSLAGIG